MAKTRTQYSTLNILTGLGGYVVNTILGLVCRMVFTRTLSAEYLGVNGLFTNILSMLSLAELGIGSAIIYALYRPLAEDDHEKVASLVQFYGKCYRVIGVVVGTAGLALMPFLRFIIRDAPAIQESLYLIYGLYLFNTASSYFFSYRSSLIMAAQQSYIVTGVSYAVTIAQSILQIGWLFATRRYIGYLIISSIGTLVYNLVISSLAVRKFPYIVGRDITPLDKDDRRDLGRNVRALTIWKLSSILVNSTDNIIITYFSGLATVGLSSNYTLLSGTLNSLLNQVFSGISASVGNLNALETTEKKMRFFYSVNLSNFWLFGWAAIGIFVCSSDIVEFLFGAGYVLPTSISFVIALNFYMVGMQNAVWIYKQTMGLFIPGRYLLFLTAAINLVCSIWLGKLWGLFGILFATAISRACTNTWYDPYAVFEFGFQRSCKPYFARYAGYALLLSATGGTCYLLCSILKLPLLASIIVKMLICTAVPNGVFFLCFHKTQEFEFFENLFYKVIERIKRALWGRRSV